MAGWNLDNYDKERSLFKGEGSECLKEFLRLWSRVGLPEVKDVRVR